MRKITAIVPVRKGSVRVKNKNLKPFSGSSLLEIKIKQLKKIENLERIVVSSDCPEMISIAKSLGVDTHVREEYFASSEASNSEFFENIAREIESDHIMYSPVTCPLLSLETYRDCISEYQNDENIESIVTATSVKHHMWLDGKPLNYKIEDSPNSQDLPDILSITYGICILPRSEMIKNRNVVTKNPSFKILDEIESVDIDTEFDFMIAEILYSKLLGAEI